MGEDLLTFIPALRAYAWTLTRRHQEVDDLVQETLTRAIAKQHLYKNGTNLRAWLMTIMRNTFLNQIVKTTRERPGNADCVSASPSAPPSQEWSIRGNEIMDAINQLPTHYRETLVLVVMLGEPYESAAQICDVAVGTIKSRVRRARSMVLERLEVVSQDDI
ncbi:sigma-70 family RNA polymerase sigma factor [Oceaniglobus roseus]|uniref:sigma-70 family RNA polymerase sigma factor n=1 Tax=Oceaniglobus roseus TaxID=1737570 RepID=UPI001FE3BA50|nr:sigma-70 family RNA polymerase sigma factor [Kandeliimicrobium roseum]